MKLENFLTGSQFPCIFVFILFFFGVFIALAIIQFVLRKQRAAELKAFAAQNGWHFDEKLELPFLRELAEYTGKIEKGLFGIRLQNPLLVSSRNVIRGNAHDRNFAIFEQTYSNGSQNRRFTRTQTLFAVEVADLDLPFFCAEPDSYDHFFRFDDHKIDIDFHTHPKFSANYLLYGQNAGAIRNLFTPPVLGFYEQQPLFTTVAGGKYLVVYREAEVYEPHQIINQLNFLFNLVNVFKYRT